MVANQLSYQQSLLALLPQGSAWLRDDDTALALLIKGLAEEFARIDARAQQLIDESLPSGVIELLERWEADYGLPDSCSSVVQTFDQRISALEQKYKLYGSQSRAFLVSLVDAYGLIANISEYKESVFGGDFGGYFWGTDWAFVVQFDIEIPDTITDIDSTKSILECSIARILHAHKYPIFVYGGAPDGALSYNGAYLTYNGAYLTYNP